MAFAPFKRYFKLNLAILIAGGLVLGYGMSNSWPVGGGIDPLAQVMGQWGSGNAEVGSTEYYRDELMATRARLFQVQDQLYSIAAELRNCLATAPANGEAAPGVIAARVVHARDLSSERRAVRIDRGSDDGIQAGMPVTCLGFLVGTTARVDAHSASVVLVEDTTFRAEVRIGDPAGEMSVPKGHSAGRPRGIYVGLGGLGGSGEVQFVAATGREAPPDQVRPGAVVYTSGSDRIPAGLPIGLVSSVLGNREGLFLDIRVTPAFDLTWMEKVQVEAKPKSSSPGAPGRGARTRASAEERK